MSESPSIKSRKTATLIMVRYPELGKVKTRLARTLGDRFALEFYSLCTRYVLEDLRALAAPEHETTPFVFVSEARDLDRVRALYGESFIYRAQRGSELGEKMYNAFQDVFAAGAERAVIVPSDAPNLSCAILAKAREVLDSRDAAFGPASDGGYYLLGLKAPHRPLFFDLPWSTDAVGRLTRERLGQLALSYGEVPLLPDIDEERDLLEWLEGPFGRGHPLKPRIEELLAEARQPSESR